MRPFDPDNYQVEIDARPGMVVVACCVFGGLMLLGFLTWRLLIA